MILRPTQTLIFTTVLLTLPTLALAAGDTNTTVTVKKGDDQDYTIVTDSEEVAGEPVVADKEARDAWKTACAQWKSDLRDLNKDNQVIAMNCGTPKAQAALNGATLYTSTATYKIRVRVRAEAKAIDPVKAAK